MRLAVRRGHQVVDLDALTCAADLRNVAESRLYIFEEADIRDRGALDRVFRAHAPCRSLDRRPGTFIETNLTGNFNLLKAARAHWQGRGRPDGRFHHISTDEVLGSLGPEGRFTQSSPYDRRSPYSASNAGSDHLVRAWGETYGLPVLLTNCSNDHGPYHFPEKLIPVVILNALHGRPIPVYGAGENVRDWLYVRIMLDPLLLVLEKGRVGGSYNVGGENERRNIDLVRTICRLLDARRPDASPHERLIEFVADRPGHDRRYAIGRRGSARSSALVHWSPWRRGSPAPSTCTSTTRFDGARCSPGREPCIVLAPAEHPAVVGADRAGLSSGKIRFGSRSTGRFARPSGWEPRLVK